jgi:hypothetical protein
MTKTEAADADAALVTQCAAMRAGEVVASSAGKILTAGSTYKERLLQDIVASAYLKGAMAGAQIATYRALSGFDASSAEHEVGAPELEVAADESAVHRAPTEPGRDSGELDVPEPQRGRGSATE